MRKIHILKAIVDLVWIFTMPVIALIIIFIPLIFFYDDFNIDLKISNIALSASDTFGKFLISIILLSYGLLIYSLFLFRKTLRYFLNLKIFDEYVIKTFQRMGVLLVISGLTALIVSFIARFHFEQKIQMEIGMNEHIVILSLGLFFMVLSEVFKIAKTAKEENELTI